jgi:hypothetical protein
MGRACSTNGGEKRNAYRILVGKPEGKRPLGRPRCKWADNVKKVIGESWFPELTLKRVLNWDLYWNKCTLYIKIQNIRTLLYVQYIIY